MKRRFIGLVTLLLILFCSNYIFADTQPTAKDIKVAAYTGTLSGDWSGESMGMPVIGKFIINISTDGNVTGTYSGFQSGTITGSINDSGQINAKGSAGISEWSGQLKSINGRLSGTGTWTGYNINGSWHSD